MTEKELANMALTAACRAEQEGFEETAKGLREIAISALSDISSPGYQRSQCHYVQSISVPALQQ